jgi:hypothetical protein
MAQHSHFHLPCEFGARTDPYSRRKRTLHCNSRVELAVVPCPEVGGNWLDCIRLGWVEERIEHLGPRTVAAADTGSAPCPVAEGNQELVDSTRALHHTLPALRQVEQQQQQQQQRMVLPRSHLRKGHVLHFQLRLSQAS